MRINTQTRIRIPGGSGKTNMSATQHQPATAKFRLGKMVATPNALAQLRQDDILRGIQRHQSGDWGEVGKHDKKANDSALSGNMRLFSVYHSANGAKFWIITEHDRSLTTVLMPEDY